MKISHMMKLEPVDQYGDVKGLARYGKGDNVNRIPLSDVHLH